MKKTTIGTANVTLVSSFTALPAISAQNLQGAINGVINFQPAQGAFTAHILTIDEQATARTLWNIVTPTSATSIALPTLPAGVTPILSNATTYDLTLDAVELSGGSTYGQLIAGNYDPSMISYSDIELAEAQTSLTR